MSQRTSIGWCVDPRTGRQGHSWNPSRGCSRESEGCTNCFAARMCARNLPGLRSPTTGEPYATMYPTGFPVWSGEVELMEHKLDEPLKRRKRTLYFVNSMSDLFHPALSDADIDKVFAVMALCPQHLFLVLTKRAERMHKYLTDDHAFTRIRPHNTFRQFRSGGNFMWPVDWPLKNCWLGVSVENDKHLDRLDWLMRTPAALRFVSLEPMLAPVNTEPHLCRDYRDGTPQELPRLDWVICSGETGPGARPMELDWARRVRDDCQAAKVPFFLKSLGCWTDDVTRFSDEQLMAKDRADGGVLWDNRVPQMVRVGRKAAGRLLDGRSWDQMPEVK